MSKHTPGPWELSSPPSHGVGKIRVSQAGEMYDHAEVFCSTQNKEGFFNAALISAAPDLLEACQARVTANTTEELEAADNLMLAAIAKATTVNF